MKCKGLDKLLTESNFQDLDISLIDQLQNDTDEGNHQNLPLDISSKFAQLEWYKYIVYFLQNLACPLYIDKNKIQYLKLKYINYCIRDGCLFWKDPLGVLLNNVLEE